MLIDVAYAMAPGEGGGGSFLAGLFPLILIFLILYVLIIRPQQKKQRQQQAMIDTLKKGDRVVTSGGVHGTVVGIKESEGILVLKIANNVNIEVSRGSISRMKS